jgi:hypothetical protein
VLQSLAEPVKAKVGQMQNAPRKAGILPGFAYVLRLARQKNLRRLLTAFRCYKVLRYKYK